MNLKKYLIFSLLEFKTIKKLGQKKLKSKIIMVGQSLKTVIFFIKMHLIATLLSVFLGRNIFHSISSDMVSI